MKYRDTLFVQIITIVFVLSKVRADLRVGVITDESIVHCENIRVEFYRLAGQLDPVIYCLESKEILTKGLTYFKYVHYIIDFSMSNKEAGLLGEMLQKPVVTNAPNTGPVGNFTLSMYPDYEFVNDITVQTLKLWDIKRVALLYDVKSSKQAANLQSLARRQNIRMFLMPEIRMDNKHSLAYTVGELKRSHLTDGVLLCDPRDIDKVMDKTIEFQLYKKNHDKWRWITPDLEIEPNCTETLDGFIGISMRPLDDKKLDKKLEKFKNRILDRAQFVRTRLSKSFFNNLRDVINLLIKNTRETFGSKFCAEHFLNITHALPKCKHVKEPQECSIYDDVEFTSKRTRKMSEMLIVQVKSHTQTPKDVGVWNTRKGLYTKHDVKGITSSKPKMCKTEKHDEKKWYKIFVKTDDAPFVIIKNESLPQHERFTGFCIDILNELKKKDYMNFEYTIEIASGSGSWQKNGSRWSGIIGKLMEKKGDMGTGSLTITANREMTIDFSKPFMDFTMALILRKPEEEKQNMFRFLDPFSTIVWLCTIAAVFAMTVFTYIVDYFSPYGYRKTAVGTEEPGDEFTLYNSLWFATASMLQQGGDNTPKSPSGRLLAASFWFFVLLMISTYTANLAAFFTNKKPKVAISNLEDLSKQNEIKYGVLSEGQTQTFLENSNDSVHKKMIAHMKKYDTFAKKSSEAVAKAREGKFAYLTETPILEYHSSKAPCNTMLIKHLLESKSYGFALPKDSELTTSLSVNILRLREEGFMGRKIRYWWVTRSQCPTQDKPKGIESMTLKFENMAGVFIVLVSGVIISFILLIVEVKFKWVVDLILEAGCEHCADYYCEDDESYDYMDPRTPTSPPPVKRVPDLYSNAQESKV